MLKRLYRPHMATQFAARSFSNKYEPSESLKNYIKEHEKLGKPKIHGNDMERPVVSRKDVENFKPSEQVWEESEVERVHSLPVGDQDRTDFYTKISEIQEGDHEVIKSAKKNIKRLLDEELEFLGFCNEVKEADEKELIEDTMKDIEKRTSFFYSYDNNKVNTNKKIYDVHAPGNIHKKPSMIVPHEHVHPQHLIDAESLTEEDIQELYGLYTYYIDLHISQVRREVDEKSYIPPHFNQLSFTDDKFLEYSIDNKFFDYYHRWREPTRTWRSQTQEIDYQKELDNLPVNDHPDPKAFTKYDVEWKEEQKFPHVANRLGYPILAEDPAETILGLERAPAHPSYQLQAFIQTPSMDPDPTLNFEKAETVYENLRVGEWVRMWRWVLGLTLPFWPAFFTFEIYQADGAPSLDWLADAGSWQVLPKQMQDSGNWNLHDVRYCDEHDYMNWQYALKRSMVRPGHTMYQLLVLSVLQNVSVGYATKMVYNKDRDLVFVYKPDGVFSDKEYVYEVHHLESMVPAPVGAYQHIGVGHKDGITTLVCMDTNEAIKLYNDPKYWNLELRDDFLSQTRTMWPNLCNKYDGRVVTINNTYDEKQEMNMKRIERELDEAEAKHGPISQPLPYNIEFADRLKQTRKKIAEAAL